MCNVIKNGHTGSVQSVQGNNSVNGNNTPAAHLQHVEHQPQTVTVNSIPFWTSGYQSIQTAKQEILVN